MVGSIGIGFWIAHAAFWLLLIFTVAVESRFRLVLWFAGLWIAGYLGSAWLPNGSAWFLAYVAALDIALVLSVFKGDIRLT